MRAVEAEADARVGCRRRSVAPSSSAVAVLVVVDVETASLPSLGCVVAAAAGVVLAVHRAEFFVVGPVARRAVGASLSSLSLSAPHLGRVGFRVCVLLLEDDDDEVVRGALSMCVSSLTGGSESNALRVSAVRFAARFRSSSFVRLCCCRCLSPLTFVFAGTVRQRLSLTAGGRGVAAGFSAGFGKARAAARAAAAAAFA